MSTFLASSQRGQQGSRQQSSAQKAALSSFKSRLGQFKDDPSGDVAMIFGMLAVMMFLFIGAAVDIGRWLHATRQTKSAIDSAVLAGARVMQVKGTNAAAVTEAKATAQKYYTQNTATRLPLTNPAATFTPIENNTVFQGVVNAKITTPFLGMGDIIGVTDINSLDVKANSEAILAVGGNAETNLEISIMLDTSGSMDGGKIDDMKLAAKDLIDIVVWDDQSTWTSKVALAPFSADVRIPEGWRPKARGNPAQTLTGSRNVCDRRGNNCQTETYTIAQLSDCVVERHGTEKFTDAEPGNGKYVTSKYNSNGSCSQPEENTAVALSNNKTHLKNKIDDLELGGGTAGHLGTAWAWYLLSPNFDHVVEANSGAVPYTQTNTKKIAILMTDGEYNTQYTAQGLSGTSPNGSSNEQAKALCDGMKAKNIEVFTVGFDLGGNSTAISTLQYCATDASHFYEADDGNALKDSFRDIALKLSTLYIRK